MPTTIYKTLNKAQSMGLTRLDAQLLLLHTLQTHDQSEVNIDLYNGRVWLLTHDDLILSDKIRVYFFDLCKIYLDGKPLAYIIGEKEFYGLRLKCDARALVPRPETEILVDWAREIVPQSGKVLDLGAGSGAIALSLAHVRPDANIFASDISEKALSLAKFNACRLNLKLYFLQMNWLDGFSYHSQFNIIVSNPPYIAQGDSHLERLKYEPSSALVSGMEGLDALSCIIESAPSYLSHGGWLLLEHGYSQADCVRKLLSAQGFSNISTRCDLSGIERCSGGALI